ncbi:UBX domain-containing protein [Neofusicoccum parvum]|nr:UBX domain-containing protein [Neofusicoccum parvum]
MFYDGDLQSGISLAIQQAKLVVCFVRDADDESKTWESEWLRDEPLATLLADKTVALRLDAGSQEAGFLSAFCPIAKTPAVIVIHNGQLRLCLVGGISREDFVSRLGAVLDPDTAQTTAAPANPAVTETAQEEIPVQAEPVSSEPVAAPSSTILSEPPAAQTNAAQMPPPDQNHTAASSEPSASLEPSSSTELGSLFPDRAARLEAEHKATQEAEAAARAAKAAGKRKAVDAEVASSGTKDPNKLSYAAQEKLRKQAQQTELNRILQRVEANKRERKEQEELPSGSRGPAAKSGDVCLRIRLLDGSQIREYFPPTATLAADVRPRVDWALGGGLAPSSSASAKPPPVPPYSFKHILAPLPNRTLGPSDETKPLNELPDVIPSATLVLIPAKNVVSAYTGAGNGYVGSIYVAMLQVYNLFATFLATFFAPFARGGGGGNAGGQEGGEAGAARGGAGASAAGQDSSPGQGQGQGQGKSSGSGSSGTGGDGIRIRTLRDQGETGNEYYNGNSLDFEPKKEDGEDGKDK